ncbi:Trypanosomal VSG domain containing protein [Trypanosoma brucei equiperdum]|uniref:Trypanosomal VSG domain containing protein n=1 Tax=Trypanosoma brucei equiperdum TaxID=630700 RepID=A0A3L6LC02_9TRYP|nr:Trypanosomal VSG domain containing protein [Trypanosoma brucei equiperdum]
MIRQVLAALFLVRAADSVANDNAPEFRVFCELVGIAERATKLSISLSSEAVTEAMSDLELLNLTAAPHSWLRDKDGELKPTYPDTKKEKRQF